MPNRSKKNNKTKSSRRRRGRRGNGYPVDRSEMTMSNTGGLIAPMATEYTRPKVYQNTRKPSRPGAEASLTGCDFVGTFSSALTEKTLEFDLNALDSSVFPRLCAIASVWRRFVFTRLTFHLFGIAAATQNGFGAMASIVTDDLGGLSTISGETEVLNMENCALVRPWSGVSHQVNCKAEGLKWYTCSPTASSTTYGDAIGRAFLYLPATTVAGDIQIQVYVSYDVEFSQRVAYQTETPASIPYVAETLRRYHEEIASTVSDAAADEGLSDSFESAFFGYQSGAFPIQGKPLIGALAQISQNYITQMFSDDAADVVNDQQEFLYLLGNYWGNLSGTILNDAYKFAPFFKEIFLGKSAEWPTSDWVDYLAKLAVPILDGLFLSGFNVVTVRTALIAALNAYTPTLESTRDLREQEKRRIARFEERRSRSPKTSLPSSTVTSTRLVKPHKVRFDRESDSRAELCLRGETLEDHRDDRPCIHPLAREGVQIWCTDCQYLRGKSS